MSDELEKEESGETKAKKPFQFTIWHLMILTAVVAIFLAIFTQVEPTYAFGFALACVYGTTIWFLIVTKTPMHWIFCFTALVIYATSFFLPAVEINIKTKFIGFAVFLGWECAMYGFIFWPSHILMIFAPIFLTKQNFARGFFAFLFFVSFLMATGCYFDIFDCGITAVYTGYVLWTLSFLLMSVCFLIPHPQELSSRTCVK